MPVIYSTHIYDYDIPNLEIYFEYNNSVIFSYHNKNPFGNVPDNAVNGNIIIISHAEILEHERLLEANRYFREDNLVIQGIISFFTGKSLTVYHNRSSSTTINPIEYPKQSSHLIIEGKDYTNDLLLLLKRLNEEPDIIISLLDRWRKAIYLKSESCDADLYYDEAILSFFHILELFGEIEKKEITQLLEHNIENMLTNYFSNYYLSNKQIKQMVKQNKKSINKILIGDHLSLSIKVKHFLEKYSLLDDNVAFFIDKMIETRNAVAHGRITHQKKFFWPLSPFFNLAKDSYETIEFLMLLTAEMISKYIGIKCWDEEWNQIKHYLMPSKIAIERFINGELVFKDEPIRALTYGNEHNITWRTLFNYYVKNPKSIIREKLELSLKEFFLNIDIDEDNAPDIFNLSLIFADSSQEDIHNKAVNNIILIIKNRWHGWSSFKDAYTYLDFYSVQPEWYKNFLENREYM